MSRDTRIQGGESIRMTIAPALTHDRIAGEVRSNAAVVYELFRQNGGSAATGDLAYVGGIGWTAALTLPTVTVQEAMRCRVTAIVQGSVGIMEKTFTVYP